MYTFPRLLNAVAPSGFIKTSTKLSESGCWGRKMSPRYSSNTSTIILNSPYLLGFHLKDCSFLSWKAKVSFVITISSSLYSCSSSTTQGFIFYNSEFSRVSSFFISEFVRIFFSKGSRSEGGMKATFYYGLGMCSPRVNFRSANKHVISCIFIWL